MRWIDLLKMLPASILSLILLTPNAGFSEGQKKDCGPGGRFDARTKRCICPEGYAVKVGRCECPEGQTEVDIEGRKGCGRMFGPAKKPLGKSGPNASEAQRDVSPSGVIYDPQQPANDPRVQTHVDATEATRVFSALWPKYLTDYDQCPEPNTKLTAEREIEKGALVARVFHTADGSFTTANVQEKLYQVSFGPCSWSGEDSLVRLVVTQGDSVVIKAKATNDNAGLRIVDIDGDGKNELVLERVEAMGDPLSARLVRFNKGKVETIQDFGAVMDDENYKHSVVRNTSAPGTPPKIVVDQEDGC